VRARETRRSIRVPTPLVVGLLINGVAYAAIFIVVALLIRRFAGHSA
jgi:hypothetical protein